MKTAKAPQTSVSRSAVSIPALLLLGLGKLGIVWFLARNTQRANDGRWCDLAVSYRAEAGFGDVLRIDIAADEVGLRAAGRTLTVEFDHPAAYFPAVAASPTLAVVPPGVASVRHSDPPCRPGPPRGLERHGPWNSARAPSSRPATPCREWPQR